MELYEIMDLVRYEMPKTVWYKYHCGIQYYYQYHILGIWEF